MSASAISLAMRARSFGSLRSAVTLFLLRLNRRKKPAPEPISRRVLSPPGGSTLITSAPRSPRIMPQVGPITMWVNSTTRMPLSGRPHARVEHLRRFRLSDVAFAARADSVPGRARLARSRARRGFPGHEGATSASACARASPACRRIEADIDHVVVEHVRARHREGHVLLDMHERHRGLSGRNVDRQAIELADDRLRVRPLLHHGEAQRHVDPPGTARRTEQDAALHADLHGHHAAERGAFARGLPDASPGSGCSSGRIRLPGVLIASVEAPWRTVDAGALDLGRRVRGRAGRRRAASAGPKKNDFIRSVMPVQRRLRAASSAPAARGEPRSMRATKAAGTSWTLPFPLIREHPTHRHYSSANLGRSQGNLGFRGLSSRRAARTAGGPATAR